MIPSDNPFVGPTGIAPVLWDLACAIPSGPASIATSALSSSVTSGRAPSRKSTSAPRAPTVVETSSKGRKASSRARWGPGSLTAPIHSYGRSVGATVIGGTVYRGESDGPQGDYFLADFVEGKVFILRWQGTSWLATDRTAEIAPDAGAIGNPTSFGEDAFGNLYLVDIGCDVFWLTPHTTSADGGDILDRRGCGDMIHAGAGDDIVRGGDGNDRLYGGGGADRLFGAGGPIF